MGAVQAVAAAWRLLVAAAGTTRYPEPHDEFWRTSRPPFADAASLNIARSAGR